MKSINPKEIIQELESKFKVLENEHIREEILREIKEWNKKLNIRLIRENPFLENKQLLKEYKALPGEKKENLNILKNALKDYSQFEQISKKKLSDLEFFRDEIRKFEDNKYLNVDDVKTLFSLLLESWEKELLKESSNWELKRISEERKKLLDYLKELLKYIEELYILSQSLLFETGFLYDLSKGNISINDINTIKHWLSILKKEKINEIIELLGRISKKEKYIETQKVKVKRTFHQTIPNSYYNEEIVGIELNKNIENTLPQEKAFMSDEELAIIFDTKFIENKLMCFETVRFEDSQITKEEFKTKKVEKEEQKGPIILCIDTSGSMSGTPEAFAKAISLYITSKAIRENRKVLIINFSTSIDVLEIDSNTGLSMLIKFLEKSFYGGTDITPAFKYAIEKMKNEKFKKADLLAISDFVMQNLPDILTDEIKKLKKKGNKFYSLIIANTHNPLYKIFDEQWVYNPKNNNIEILLNLSNSLNK